ncbi:MAG: PDZ domain-containing protein [Planctomycetes bacterium]|nr:PDZ domain-containing protein [Planctomycetota bacterium]
MQQPENGTWKARPRTLARGWIVVLSSFLVLSFFLAGAPSTAQKDGGKEKDYPRIFRDVARHLDHYYLDLERMSPRPLLEKAFTAIENSVDEIYVEDSDPGSTRFIVHVDSQSQAFDLDRVADLDEAVRLLEGVFEFIKRHYKGETPLNEVRYAAINGFLSGLDPHTLVFPPEDYKDFAVHIEGEICGVGMYVGTREGKLTVIEVLKGTPAQRAGFKKNDLIAKIGDESTINMTVNEAVDKIRGPCGSAVTLTVKRPVGDDPEKLEAHAISVQRDRVVIKSVESALIPDWNLHGGPWKGGVGYVQVINFDKNTMNRESSTSLEGHLRRLEEQNGGKPLAGLILDLRGNSGGLLTQAVAMSDLFLESGNIVVTANRGGTLRAEEAKRDGTEPSYPIVVLANEASASGAEIVIGALQKNNRALVLGTRTFGKGSVQQLHQLSRQSSAQLKITVSEYLIPGNISIQENGVVPDLMVGAVVDDGNFDLFENERSVTEKSYERHLVSLFARKESPRYTLHYLFEPPEGDAYNDRFMSGELEPSKDKLVQVALRLLELAQKPFDPARVLDDRPAEVQKIKADLFQEVVAKLKEKGIDWSPDPAGGPSAASEGQLKLEVSSERIQEPSKDKDDKVPVNKLLITARLANKGDVPVHRMKGITRSEYFLYKDHELLFGKVDPGQTVERTAKVRLPYYPYARNDLLTVEVSSTGEMPDGDGPPQDKVLVAESIQVDLKDSGRPAFAYTATLLDGAGGQPIQALDVGQEAVLKVKVKNVGTATAHKGVVVLKNETGRQVFLHPPGRPEFSDLAPGAEKEVQFRFDVREGDPVDDYELELAAADSYSNASLARKLKIPRKGSEAGKPFPNGVEFAPPVITASLLDPETQRPVLTTGKDKLNLEALIRASEADPFKAWIVSSALGAHEAAPDKILVVDSGGQNPLKIATPVSLKKGINLITVVSNDRNGLESRQSLVVRRE